MRALQADRIAARQRARDSAARARRTAEEREDQEGCVCQEDCW